MSILALSNKRTYKKRCGKENSRKENKKEKQSKARQRQIETYSIPNHFLHCFERPEKTRNGPVVVIHCDCISIVVCIKHGKLVVCRKKMFI